MTNFDRRLMSADDRYAATVHDKDARIRVLHDADAGSLEVRPIGCGLPLRSYADLDRFVDALVSVREIVRHERTLSALRRDASDV